MHKILFRADSSSTIGTGHIMRDLVLAKQYPDSEIVFATQDLEGDLNSKIIESGYKVKLLSSNHIDELVAMVKKLEIDKVVIDHYDIDYVFEKVLKEKTDVQLMVLDDTYEEHFCDVLLNHNIYADENRYKNLVPEGCKLQCGSKFTLLREEFHVEKANKKPFTRESTHVFLAMGGADSANLNIDILEVLEKFSSVHTHVVTTNANQYLEELQVYVRSKENITLHINSNELGKLMIESHFAIVSPSVTLNEINFMGLPFVSIQTADNQSAMVSFLEKNKFLILKEFDSNILYDALKSSLVFDK